MMSPATNTEPIFELTEEFELAYKSFFVRRNFIVDFGCFPDSQDLTGDAKDQVLTTCLIGEFKDFNLI